MNQMTIGQRITEERKKLGLSQEALGEKLGVSRQAISKWESDSAIPDIDKLISLSKLFSVSVGFLLGVETPDVNKDETENKEEVLSEQQLKTIEDIFQKYQEPPRRRRWGLPVSVVSAAVAMAALFFGITALKKANSLNDFTSQLQFLQNNYNQISYQLSSVNSALESLESKSNLLSQWDISLEADGELAGVYASFTGTPQRQQAGDTCYFSIRQKDQQILSQECIWNGSVYIAGGYVPNGNEYRCTYSVIHEDGSIEHYVLPLENGADILYYDLDYLLSYHVASFMGGSYSSLKRNTMNIDFIDVSIDFPYFLEENRDIISADLIVLSEESEVSREEIYRKGSDDCPFILFDPFQDDGSATVSAGTAVTWIEKNIDLTLEPRNPGSYLVDLSSVQEGQSFQFVLEISFSENEEPFPCMIENGSYLMGANGMIETKLN